MPSNIFHGPDVKPFLPNISLGELFFHFAHKHGDKTFQINADTDESETFASALQRSIRLALILQKKGVTSADVVVTCSQNTIDSIIPTLSTLLLGAKVANLDPSQSSRDITHLLNLTTPKIIFVSSSSADLVQNCYSKSDIIVFETFFPCLLLPQPNEKEFKPTKVSEHDITWILFSSGTTGLPKGICHSHYTVLRMTENFLSHNFDTKVLMHFATLYWISTLLMTTAAVVEGSAKVVSNNTTDGEAILRAIEKYEVTLLFTAPTNTYSLTHLKDRSHFHIPNFRHFLTGGTSISNQQLTKLSEMFDKTYVFNNYGLSEIGLTTTFDVTSSIDAIKTKIGSSGKTACNNILKIVNAKEETLGPYTTGELRFKSPGCFIGYYKQDCSMCFDAEGFLKTGDLGYVDSEGYIYIVGRIKEMFKYKSWHIVPASIEAVLIEHPSVKECIVYGVPVEELGEVPAAAVELKKNENIDITALEQYAAAKLLDREQLRGGLKIVKKLPRTATGKIVRANIQKFLENEI